MKQLQLSYDKLDDIEAPFRELFTETNGKFVFGAIPGLKTQADIDRLTTALTAERTAHKGTKDRLRPASLSGKAFVEMTDDELKTAVEKLDKYDELEAAAGKLDDTKLNSIVDSRLRQKLAPVEREREQFKLQLAEAVKANGEYQLRERRRLIDDAVLAAKVKSQFADAALPDIQLNAAVMLELNDQNQVVTRDQVGVTPGVSAEVWLAEMQAKGRLWWPATSGGGARGGNNNGFHANPWSAQHWNLTEQGRMVVSDPTKAEQMAASAGVAIGATKPAKPA